MKQEWQKPSLEVLDVEMTMGQATGTKLDADFPSGTPFSDLTFS
jgi:hypothetical protein